MNSGMLWFDNDKKTTFNNKIDQAANYYQKKYGHAPDICLVHPQMVSADKDNQFPALEVKASPTVLLHHFWLGTKQPIEKEIK
jgi:hypothetical protein